MANELLEQEIATLEAAALWAAGGRGDEPSALSRQRPTLRLGPGGAHLAPLPRRAPASSPPPATTSVSSAPG